MDPPAKMGNNDVIDFLMHILRIGVFIYLMWKKLGIIFIQCYILAKSKIFCSSGSVEIQLGFSRVSIMLTGINLSGHYIYRYMMS